MIVPKVLVDRIKRAARRLDAVYAGGWGNETGWIENELLRVALLAAEEFDPRRAANGR